MIVNKEAINAMQERVPSGARAEILNVYGEPRGRVAQVMDGGAGQACLGT